MDREKTGLAISVAGVIIGFIGAFAAIQKMNALSYQLGSYFGASQSPAGVILSEPMVMIGIVVAIGGAVYRGMESGSGGVDGGRPLYDCPICKEPVREDAEKCRHCGSELSWEEKAG